MAATADITSGLDGTSTAAIKLLVPRKINGVNFDGTADITVPASLDYSLTRGTHLIGGSVSFNGTSNATWSVDATANNITGKIVSRDSTGNFSAGEITATFNGNLTGDITGDVFSSNGVRILDSGNTGSNATFVGDVTGNVSGNAGTASKLLIPRTINGVSFDGTANIVISANVNAGLSAGSSYIAVNKSGGNSNDPYTGAFAETWNIKADSSNIPSFIVARNAQGDFTAGTITASLNGNASTATRLATPRNINGIAFDGTSNITVRDDSKFPTTGGQVTGFVTLHARPTQAFHAATKEYVDYKTQSVEDLIPPIFISLDTKGLNETAQGGPGSVVELLNTLAPPHQFAAGTQCRIASTIQNVSSVATSTTGRFIGRSFLTGTTVTTTVNNPSRNNDLIYQVNNTRSSWQYVSG